MKKYLLALFILLSGALCLSAESALNNKADNILGKWKAVRNGEVSKVCVTKLSDGSYQAQVYWLEVPLDKKGNPKLDVKNPDKSLRSTPADQIVLFKGLKYNADKKRWDGCEIYDPTKGLKAKCTVEFQEDGRLRIKGSLLGISQSVYWERLSE
ncbi:MAG: DUF2147 domain-containing protein [Bacteroidales bacterium]|nr:DUF2147 domain-containing protein [Bacteroidales bacterium]